MRFQKKQYRLRTLFLWVTFCCALVGAVAAFRRVDHAQITYSSVMGWDVFIAWKGEPLREVGGGLRD